MTQVRKEEALNLLPRFLKLVPSTLLVVCLGENSYRNVLTFYRWSSVLGSCMKSWCLDGSPATASCVSPLTNPPKVILILVPKIEAKFPKIASRAPCHSA